MEFLQFTFQDFAHFLGVCLLILVIGYSMALIMEALRK